MSCKCEKRRNHEDEYKDESELSCLVVEDALTNILPMCGACVIENGESPFMDAIPDNIYADAMHDYERLFVHKYLDTYHLYADHEATFENIVEASKMPDYMSKNVFRDCMWASEYAHEYCRTQRKKIQQATEAKEEQANGDVDE